MACTVKVSNVSPKATIREIEEFFSCSGQIEGINLNSDGEDSQTAYVTFKDHDSMKMALLLSGSAILDKEVDISAVSKPGTEELAPDYCGNDSLEAEESSPLQGRPGGINRVQDIVTSMLARGLSVGKDAMRRAHVVGEKSKKAVDGDALKSMNESLNPEKRGGDVGNGGESESKSNTDKGIKHEVNEAGEHSMTPGDAVTAGVFHESKPKSSNVRESVQKCYNHVCTVNEKLQIGQRTMSVLTSAQQGVVSAGSAVANNKFVAAGGGWVSGALSRVPLINRNVATSHDGKGSSQQEHVQLTEMTSFPTHKSEH